MIRSENERLRLSSPERDSKVRVLAEEIEIWKNKYESLQSRLTQYEEKVNFCFMKFAKNI